MSDQRFDVSFENLKESYRFQEWIHSELQKEYREKGLIYGGRTRYADLHSDNKIDDNGYFGRHQMVGSSHQINDYDNGWGYAGWYTKLDDETKKIHQDFLHKIYDSLLEVSDKHILDKFKEYDFSALGDDGFKKLIKISKELLVDIKTAKEWAKEAEKIINDAERQFQQAMKRNKPKLYLLSMNQLEDIGRAILGLSTEYCPIETGFLRSSGNLYVYDDHIRIIYECPYAGYVHENINAVHPIGQAKFLERAAQEILPKSSVWTEFNGNSAVTTDYVEGSNMRLYWEKNKYGTSVGDAVAFVEHKQYLAVYIDIDRNLKINGREE